MLSNVSFGNILSLKAIMLDIDGRIPILPSISSVSKRIPNVIYPIPPLQHLHSVCSRIVSEYRLEDHRRWRSKERVTGVRREEEKRAARAAPRVRVSRSPCRCCGAVEKSASESARDANGQTYGWERGDEAFGGGRVAMAATTPAGHSRPQSCRGGRRVRDGSRFPFSLALLLLLLRIRKPRSRDSSVIIFSGLPRAFNTW